MFLLLYIGNALRIIKFLRNLWIYMHVYVKERLSLA